MSFDVIYMYSNEFINELPELERVETATERWERFIDRIVLRKWIGDYYALPYTTIVFPLNPERTPAEHDLLIDLIMDFFRSPEVRSGLLKFSFPEREMPMELLESIVGSS